MGSPGSRPGVAMTSASEQRARGPETPGRGHRSGWEQSGWGRGHAEVAFDPEGTAWWAGVRADFSATWVLRAGQVRLLPAFCPSGEVEEAWSPTPTAAIADRERATWSLSKGHFPGPRQPPPVTTRPTRWKRGDS